MNDDNATGLLCTVCAAAVGALSKMAAHGELTPIVGTSASCALCHRPFKDGFGVLMSKSDCFFAFAGAIETLGQRITPIPVSERLPEFVDDETSLALYYSEEVLVCIGHRYLDGRFDDFNWHLGVLASEPEYYRSDEKFWKISEYRECEDRVEIADSTHWMPKPPLPPKPE